MRLESLNQTVSYRRSKKRIILSSHHAFQEMYQNTCTMNEIALTQGEGGTHIGMWYENVPPSRTAFSGHILATEAHLFKTFFQVQRLHFHFLKKTNLAFRDQLLPSLTKFDTNFSKNVSSGDPVFENLGGTYLPKFLSTISLRN